MHKYDHNAPQLVLYKMETQNKNKNCIKVNREALRKGNQRFERCQSSKLKLRDKIILRGMLSNIIHARQIIGGSQTENKVYFLSTILTQSMASRIHGQGKAFSSPKPNGLVVRCFCFLGSRKTWTNRSLTINKTEVSVTRSIGSVLGFALNRPNSQRVGLAGWDSCYTLSRLG